MKRILGVLFFVGVMVMPTVAAAAEQIGVYVAPKFVYGLTQMDSAKQHWTGAAGASGSERIGNETDSAFGGSIAIGYDFDKKFGVPVRAELEYAAFSEVEAKRNYTDNGEHITMKQNFNLQTLFVNAYWDINTGTQFTPYIGAGLGMGFINTKGKESGYGIANPAANSWNYSTGSKNVTNFAWNVGAGLGYDLTENWTLDAGYRFVGLGSVKTKTYDNGQDTVYGKTSNLYQHQFAVGVRYTF
ncbi:outer membrane beta-barrel protein [Desulfovibrio sp. OttesenSCG-928-G11]|nr:outer membrane beta-barrel protein [Desulfovibrio sp. OttesenSCG-928-G11]